jgi:hypothetical protein
MADTLPPNPEPITSQSKSKLSLCSSMIAGRPGSVYPHATAF